MMPPLAGWSTRSTSPRARNNQLELSLQHQLLSSNISPKTSFMPSPPVPTCLLDCDALVPTEAKQPTASSMNCWGFNLQDPESIRVGSELDRYNGGEQHLREDSDLFKFLSIPTCAQSLDSEFPQRDTSTGLSSKTYHFSSLPSVEDPASQERRKESSEERTIQLGPHLPHDTAVYDTLNSQLAGGDRKFAKNLHSGRDTFPIVTSAWDGKTVSPKDAFLDYDHVYKKLEDEATRRASHSWINNCDITLNKMQPIANLPENQYHLPDEPSLTADSSPPHLDQRFTIDTNGSYSCNSSTGKRVLKSPDELTVSQFSLPPQCVPKNAIRWTQYNTTSGFPSNLETQFFSACEKPASANSVENIETNVCAKDEMPFSIRRQSKCLNTSADLPTSGPSELLACNSTGITPNCEEFSASSEDETSTLETETTGLELVEKSEQHIGMRHSEQKTRIDHLEKSINKCSSIAQNGMKSSHKRSSRPKDTEWYQLDATFDELPSENSHSISRCQIQFTGNDSVKLSDTTWLEPTSSPESACPCNAVEGHEIPLNLVDSEARLNVSTDNIESTVGDQGSEEKESGNRSPASSLAHANKIRETKTCSKTSQAKNGDQVRKGRRAWSSSYHTLSPYPRVTRSSFGLGSSKSTGLRQSPTTPINAPGRATRKISTRAAQNDCLTKPCRSPIQTLQNVIDDSSSNMHPTGPIMCGHVDEKTGGKCETMFKRPYDLARHKETIHDTKGPGGDRKPQWRCVHLSLSTVIF
ncbi:hypothetical protein PTTG_26755 [Puccinia triticina 1-1 BBBD Race 1]|uniref:Uncharacterized protein n=2 Tax=Puccinia triticina TaxID=208348 RepID=A0A180GRB2_PUCT1|nr:hypothetical protein PTTG_26755 [Puccinia triticina 1-1 BBBD Race 1]